MKKIIKKTFLFFLPILLIAYPLDYLISTCLKNPNSAKGEAIKWDIIYKKKVDAQTYIYGSSRARQHFNVKIIEDNFHESSYNFGIEGHNFLIQYLLHKEISKFNPTPKTIIFSIDYFTFEQKNGLYNQEQFLPYMLFNESFRSTLSKFNGFSFWDYYLPLIRYIGRSKSINMAYWGLYFKLNKIQYNSSSYKGFNAQNKVWNNDLETAKSDMNNYYVKFDTSAINLFQKFIRECKKDNINLILVYSPEFYEGQHFVQNRNELIEKINKISIDNDLTFLDYSHHPLSFEKKYFYNTLHLNKEGSDLFTHIFCQDIKKINFHH